MNYSPEGYFLWDTWYMPVGDLVHCFHLSRRRPGVDEKTHDDNGVRHCVSRDLIDWEDRGQILVPDPNNPDDSGNLFTGCARWHEGRGYLWYCMRASSGPEKEGMALATSDDGDHWTKYAHNPVIVPDPRWYATFGNPFAFQECRDLTTIPDPAGGWFGYYAARLKEGRELVDTHCIACVHSDDLIHWEHLPPAFAPHKYNIAEVPEVFELNGKYYMTLLTGHSYGNRGMFSDPNVTTGTIYAVADKLSGPFYELKNNVLLGSSCYGPLSARSVMFQGQRHLMYADHEYYQPRDGGGNVVIGTLSTPKLFRTSGDALQAVYCDRIESRVVSELVGPANPVRWRPGAWRPYWSTSTQLWRDNPDGSVTGDTRTGMDARMAQGELEHGIIEVSVVIERGVAAGVAFRQNEHGTGATIVLDAQRGVIEYEDDTGFNAFREVRQAPVVVGKPMRLRVVTRGEQIEAYLDDVLYLAFPRYWFMDYRGFGLFMDRSLATFRDLRVRTLKVKVPWKK